MKILEMSAIQCSKQKPFHQDQYSLLLKLLRSHQ